MALSLCLPCVNSPQPNNDTDLPQMRSESIGQILKKTIRDRDEELYNVCNDNEKKTFEDRLKERTVNNNSKQKYYYLVLEHIWDEFKVNDSNIIFDIIKESLSNENYEHSCEGLIVSVATKQESNILKCILEKGEKDEKLKDWLGRKDIHKRSILTLVILELDKETSNIKHDTKCIDILLEYKAIFDIDAQDKYGNTALHYAVQNVGREGSDRDTWTLENIAKTLIKSGACSNLKNNKGKCVMDRIPANAIEDVLNTCLKEYNGSSIRIDRKDENYKLEMDFNIFSHKESLPVRNESDFIRGLSASKNQNHLIYHPVITTFLHIKWQKIRYLWYLDLLVNSGFYFLIFFYMFYYRKDTAWIGLHSKDQNLIILKTIITVIGSLLLLGEIIQMAILKIDYLKGLENYLELGILSMTWMMLYVKDMATEKSLAAWLVVCMTMMILLLFEKLHLLGMSLYISMFRKISYNFMKLALLLFWMVLAFAISFYLLIHITTKEEAKNEISVNNKTQIVNQTVKEPVISELKNVNVPIGNQIDNEYEKEELKNDAVRLLNAFLNTVIMSTGEFNFSSIDFQDVFASRLLFAVFLFSIFLVGMNLLNGVAIHDIQIIKNDASKYKVRDQAECVISFGVFRSFFFTCFKSFRHFKDMGLIFPKCFPKKVCSLFPNRHKSTTWVKCNGYHKESCFEFLNVSKCFKSNSTYINEDEDCEEQKPLKCNECGVAKDVCKRCMKEKQSNNVHQYMIPKKIVQLAKQIKEELERKEQKKETDSRLLKIEKIINSNNELLKSNNDLLNILLNTEKNKLISK